ARPGSKRLSTATGTTAQRRTPPANFRLGVEEAAQVALELRPGEIARVDPIEAGPAGRPGRDQPVLLEAPQGLLDSRDRRAEQAGELPGIALAQELQREQRPRPRQASERGRP